jgi:hypothetical protein
MKDKEIFTTVKPEIVFGQLFQSRDTMHIVHLQTLNYSEHKALDAYYFGTLGGKRINFKIPASEYVNANQHLTQMFDYLKKHRGVFGSDNTHIQNIVDEILALISSTIYQLTLT